MSCFLQVRCLDVWRVTEEGTRPRITNKERQLDTLDKSILLSSICVDPFNHVYSLTNAHDIWTSLIKIHEGTKDMRNEKYHMLVTKLNSIKQQPH